MNLPPKLYKYVIPDRIDILKNQLIRFTQPSALNDPFELCPIFDKMFSENETKSMFKVNFNYFEESLRKHYSELPKKTREKTIKKLISHAKKNPHIVQKYIDEIAPFIKNEISNFTPKAKELFSDVLQTVGILSLSEKANHPLLWAHYAASHKGFAIEFIPEQEFFHRRRSDNDEFFHLRKVKYADKSSLSRTLSDMNSDDLLATKGISWEYEAEWRMIVPLDTANRVFGDADKIYLYTVPLSSISSIIIGARASSNLYDELNTLLQSNDNQHITLKKAKLNPVDESIQIDEI